MGWTSIPVKEETRDKLAEIRGDETWDELIASLIDEGREPEYVLLEPSEHRKIAEELVEVLR